MAKYALLSFVQDSNNFECNVVLLIVLVVLFSFLIGNQINFAINDLVRVYSSSHLKSAGIGSSFLQRPWWISAIDDEQTDRRMGNQM